ncbi:MAG: DUF1348 family protein [Ilumatobacter sp.]|uniref:DUF1348 family protein n=1 Tax=Ilumatobacter sp. TaxID=1967498 RepID=UPI003919C98E
MASKWAHETEYALRKDLWTFVGDRIPLPVRVARRRWPVVALVWNENWEFDEFRLVRRCEASINDVEITLGERRIFGERPDGDQTASQRLSASRLALAMAAM